MAAEVDFGDRELFEQLEGDEDEDEEEEEEEKEKEAAAAAAAAAAGGSLPLPTGFDEATEELRQRLRGCEEKVRDLQEENRELKRKLNMLTRPSGLTVNDSKVEGPLLQILFMNNTISKQYHQEIEDFVSCLAQRYEEQQRDESDKTSFNVKPQPSSFVLEENRKVEITNTSKKIKEAFSVVGSVLYFANFCLDKLGQPILNENPQLTDGWEIPKYQQVFTQILSLDGQEIQVKPKSRPKAHCFNCGSENHQMKDCPQPRNAARINEKRKQFLDACGETGSQSFQQRYHADEIEERFGRFKPGIISEELQDALGVTDKTLPPFIYRMRQLGYPPGWLKEAELEKSGLTLYDGKASPSDEPNEEDFCQQNRRITYDISKLVNYPGFNISTPSGVTDEWRLFGSVPLQPSQQKEIFAHYLSTYHSATAKSKSKRHSSQHSSHHSKRHKGNSAEVPVADMEMDSDLDPQSSPGYDAFQFQPPLPPGSPQNMTPPPLPRGTPPCTPPHFTPPHPPAWTPPPLPRDTPPLTPSSDAAGPRAEGSTMDEDTLTLEELEEQQRLIWAALEQADSGNSDSDVLTSTPVMGNSVGSSPARAEPEVVLEEAACKKLEVSEPGSPTDGEQAAKGREEPEKKPVSAEELVDLTEEPEPREVSAGELVDLTEEESPGQVLSKGTDENCPSTSEDPGEDPTAPAAAPGVGVSCKNASPVPDMSKFAEGITPFEFENMAESTGVYLRIRSVLKNSPRNQQRNKKPSL